MCRDNSHELIKYLLGICVCFMEIGLSHRKFAPKWSISYFQPILAAILATIAMVKVELIPDFYSGSLVEFRKN